MAAAAVVQAHKAVVAGVCVAGGVTTALGCSAFGGELVRSAAEAPECSPWLATLASSEAPAYDAGDAGKRDCAKAGDRVHVRRQVESRWCVSRREALRWCKGSA